MTIIQRTIPKAIKVAEVAGFAGLGIYCTKQFSTAFAESNEPKPVFSGLGFTTLRLQSTKTVNHNTKRLVFEYPNESARSGLTLTCKTCPLKDGLYRQDNPLTFNSRAPSHHPSGRELASYDSTIYSYK